MTTPLPHFVVLRGEPDDVELAALVVALLAVAAEPADAGPGGVNWSNPTWFTPPGSWTAR
ncbi:MULTISPECIES: acyl-CoA carboxylase epsilon subunit [unclassified Saccharothrix]|uniref:acyl-CoA carboxylase epsilon subunit n=1 Tax=unclassified Saccharothrix TaxID=2593673 RepID=UPI00307FC102